MAKYLIVGVDPGTTCAAAAMDFTGHLIGIKSSKDMGVSHVVKYILSIGKPSLIASDVNPAPEFVSTIASNFGVPLFTPEKSLQVSEKLNLTRPYETADAHQRDALAAVLYAHSTFKKKFKKIDSLGFGDEVKHRVLQGQSISAAKSAIEKEKTETKIEASHVSKQPKQKPRSAEQKRIRDLEKQVKVLQAVISERESEIRRLADELAKARRIKHTKPKGRPIPEKKIASYNHRIYEMEKTQSLLKQAASGDVILVEVYPQVKNGFTLIEHKPDKTDGIRTAFTSKNKVREYLVTHGVEVHDSKELKQQGEYYYIHKQRLVDLEEMKPSIEQIITEYKKTRT